MTGRLPAAALSDPRALRAIAVLAVTQMIGWTSAYYFPAVLLRPISAELSIGAELVIGGVSIMLVMSGVVSPTVGRLTDRFGSAPVMAAGSVVCAAALAGLASSIGPLTWIAAWAVAGIALPMMLFSAGFAALAQALGSKSRPAMTALTLITGFTSTIGWPLTAWLGEAIGWRGTLYAFAAVHLAVCLPLHAFALPRRVASTRAGAADDTLAAGRVPQAERPAALALMTLGISLAGFVTWGLSLLIPELLKQLGLSAATAMWIATLYGPFQVASRLSDLVLGPGRPMVPVAAGTAAALAGSLALLGLAGASPVAAIGVIAIYGAASGLIGVLRAALPLELFGAAQYATYAGRMTRPLSFMFAAAPVAFAFVLDEGGPYVLLALAVTAALLSLAAMLVLAARLKRCDRPPGESA